MRERKGWRKEGKGLAILYKILNGEMSSNSKLRFSSYELSNPMRWKGRKEGTRMNLPVQDGSNQLLLPSAGIRDDDPGLVNVRAGAQHLVLWWFFSYETRHVSTGCMPGSSAFVWRELDRTANLRCAWPPMSTKPTCRRNASINSS